MNKVFLFDLMLVRALIASTTQAQVTTGTVKGVVIDPNGAVVQNASVTIANKHLLALQLTDQWVD